MRGSNYSDILRKFGILEKWSLTGNGRIGRFDCSVHMLI